MSFPSNVILTCRYTIPTFLQGAKRDLEDSDLTETLSEHKSSRLGNLTEKRWNNEEITAQAKNRSPSLLKVLFKVFGWEFVFLGLVLFISESIR